MDTSPQLRCKCETKFGKSPQALCGPFLETNRYKPKQLGRRKKNVAWRSSYAQSPSSAQSPDSAQLPGSTQPLCLVRSTPTPQSEWFPWLRTTPWFCIALWFGTVPHFCTALWFSMPPPRVLHSSLAQHRPPSSTQPLGFSQAPGSA